MLKKITGLQQMQDSRALAGLSMGGLQTLYAGIKNTDMFSYLGVFSSGWMVPMSSNISDPQYEFMKNNAATINSNLKSFLDFTGW